MCPYDLQNERVIHWSDNRALVTGPLRAPSGELFYDVSTCTRVLYNAYRLVLQGPSPPHASRPPSCSPQNPR